MSFIGRLFADPIRKKVGSFVPIRIGLVVGLCGMLTVLFAQSAYLCLFGYALMGIGLAPVVPTLFSLAGSVPGISPQRASSTVAFLAYGGLLSVPRALDIWRTLARCAPRFPCGRFSTYYLCGLFGSPEAFCEFRRQSVVEGSHNQSHDCFRIE